MHITLAAIGKAGRAGLESQLFEHYRKRIPWKITLKELEDKKSTDAAQRKEKEAALLLGACEGHDRMVALDEKGKSLASLQFAKQLQAWQNQSASSVAFVIGGAAGLHPSLLQRSNLVLSFSTMTWPHLLVRALLAEQLYRAHTILSGHPYHRE